MAFTDIKKVRDITNNKLTRTKVSDSVLNEIIEQATATINGKINVEVREEEVRYLDETRKNIINDGTTTTFYVKNGRTNYLADANDDGEVTTSDLRVYKVDKDGIRSELTISSINVEDGSFTLSSAPGTDTAILYVWYSFSFYNVTTPDKLVELLATYLSAAYAYLQKDHNLPSSTKFGNITVNHSQQSTAYQKYWNRYRDLLFELTIPPNKPRIKQYKNLI